MIQGLVIIRSKICTIRGDIWETPSGFVVQSTTSTDVRGVCIGDVGGQSRVVIFEIMRYGGFLVGGDREVIREATGGGEEFGADSEIGLQGGFAIKDRLVVV